MSHRQPVVMLALLALVAGLAGGVLSSRFLQGEIAWAERTGPQKVIQAEKFEVLGKNGKPQAWLTVAEDGSPRLVLFDKDGTGRAVVTVFGDGSPGFALFDKNGTTRAWLIVKDDGSPGLGLAYRDGENRAELTLKGDGSPGLVFADRFGTKRAMFLLEDGSPGLVFVDQDGKRRMSLAETANGASTLTLFDKAGNPVPGGIAR